MSPNYRSFKDNRLHHRSSRKLFLALTGLKSAADSGVEFENYPCPSPHTVHNHPYINENLFEETEDSQDTVDYVDMCANRLCEYMFFQSQCIYKKLTVDVKSLQQPLLFLFNFL